MEASAADPSCKPQPGQIRHDQVPTSLRPSGRRAAAAVRGPPPHAACPPAPLQPRSPGDRCGRSPAGWMGAGEGRSDRVGGAGRRRPSHAPTALQPALLTLMPSLRTILAAGVANGKQKSEAGAGGGRGLVAAAQRARRPAPLCTGASTVGAWDQPGQHVGDVNCTGGLALDSRLCRTVAGGPGARRPPSQRSADQRSIAWQLAKFCASGMPWRLAPLNNTPEDLAGAQARTARSALKLAVQAKLYRTMEQQRLV